MRPRQQILLTTILLLVVVFVIGILIGGTLRAESTSAVSKLLRQSELSAESFLIEQDFFESFEPSCGLAQQRLASLSQELWQLGKVLGKETAREDLGESDYTYLKRKYHLLQIKTYVLYRKLELNCGIKANVIVFYFTQNDPLSEQQGHELDRLVDEFGVHVFAIELGYSPDLAFLEQYYKVSRSPAVIVNFEQVLTGPVSREKLIPLLHG